MVLRGQPSTEQTTRSLSNHCKINRKVFRFSTSAETFFPGADKNIENDEPLFFSSSSDEDEPTSQEVNEPEDASQPRNPRKRPAGGHTPLDLAKCQKVTRPSKYFFSFYDANMINIHVDVSM